MPWYLWVAAVVACVSAWFGLNLQPFTFNTLRLQRQFATTTAPRAPTAGPFTFYKLSLQWPPAVCNSGGMTCKPPIPKIFTIHGIWPQDNNDVPVPPYDPTNPCTSVTPTPATDLPTKLNPILNDLVSLWPNLKDPQSTAQNFQFWEHEWTKHGMCSDYPDQPRDYFNSALQLRKGLNPGDYFYYGTYTWVNLYGTTSCSCSSKCSGSLS
ncbi:ribonuclease S-4-like isoform X2 [Durio zibethinus]|uniref:Ribonuclease S-4-like isoform X2 n=1 Tax=Durio zibethinus TaxID=66656 RepID=A0A6P5ZVY3_DURZI|nr:ribonuclease S-4-like isoform X2 [Durio zibethinus]